MHKGTKLAPIRPGEILTEEFLKPHGISMHRLALDLHVPANRIGEIVHGLRSISPDTALRLARYFNTSAQLWMNLQTNYDLEITKDKELARIEREVHPAA